MHIRFHAVCVKSPRFPIVHVTVKVVTTYFARNPVLVARHFPHLPFVLVVDQLVKFWDNLRGEDGVV
jgi:hypothetical protein